MTRKITMVRRAKAYLAHRRSLGYSKCRAALIKPTTSSSR